MKIAIASRFARRCTAGAAVSRSRTDAAQPTANSVIGGAVWLPVGNDTRIVDTPWVNTRDRRYLLQAAKFRLSRSMHSLQAHGSFTASMSTFGRIKPPRSSDLNCDRARLPTATGPAAVDACRASRISTMRDHL